MNLNSGLANNYTVFLEVTISIVVGGVLLFVAWAVGVWRAKILFF